MAIERRRDSHSFQRCMARSYGRAVTQGDRPGRGRLEWCLIPTDARQARVKEVPEPLSPRYRSRFRKWNTPTGAAWSIHRARTVCLSVDAVSVDVVSTGSVWSVEAAVLVRRSGLCGLFVVCGAFLTVRQCNRTEWPTL